MSDYDTAIVRFYGVGAGRPTAGLGLLIGRREVVTCAHVVNAALGRTKREQAPPTKSDILQVEFPFLPGTPVRLARIAAWVPPPPTGEGSGDVAGLDLLEEAPQRAKPARFASATPKPGTPLRVFGYPGTPAREGGGWVDVDLKGKVGGGMLQVESRSDQTIKAQPGFSGSPVWDDATGTPVGLLHAAPFADEPERDAYLLSALTVAEAWEEHFDYLLIPENPYRGLAPFTAEYASVFFGRSSEISDLTDLVNKQPVTVIVGPSGVGKSSLVQAGLIPALLAQHQWSIALIRPGQDPWQRLAAGLLRARNDSQAPTTFEQSRLESERLRSEGFGALARFLRSENRPLLIVVDQFEELLAGGSPDPGLLDLLLPLPEAAEPAARLVLTFRADFQATLQAIPGSHTRLNQRLYLLSPLTTQQVRQVVERPASTRGVGFEGDLVNRILADATGGALPVLEFSLTKLWDTQRRKTMTFAGYNQMGGVRGALNQFADEQAARLTDTSADVLDRVLLRLVHTPVGNANLATRQRVFQADLSDAEWEVVRRLGEARLVTLDMGPTDGRAYAELVHESLITAWQRLNNVIADNADFLTWLSRVQDRADEGELLPEARIAEARRWLDARPYSVPAAIATFIESSETAAEARLRELTDARDRAEAAREQAEKSARRAEALRLAADAELVFQSAVAPTVIALALAVESVLTTPTRQGCSVLRRAGQRHPKTLARLNHDGLVNAVAFSPDGTRVATASKDSSARIFDAATGEQLARLSHDSEVNAVAFNLDGSRIATASNHSARVFDAATGIQLIDLNIPAKVYAVTLSAFGNRLAVGSGASPGPARLFDATTGDLLLELDHGGRVNAVAFSRDGTFVATGSDDHSARVFITPTGEQLARLDHEGHVRAVAFSPDGDHVATASDDSSARVFDVRNSEQLILLQHDNGVNAVAFSPDGTRIATGGGTVFLISSGFAQIFDATTGRPLALLNHGYKVNSVAFSPDSTLLVTGSGDTDGHGSARVFDATSGVMLSRLDHDGRVNAVTFSPDGTRVATASDDGSARVFKAAAPELTRLDLEAQIWTGAFSPDCTRIVSGGERTVHISDAATRRQLIQIEHDNDVNAVVFSSDGTRIATGCDDNFARIFNATTGQELLRFEHDNSVNAVAFSSDGDRLATASSDNSIRISDATTGEQLARFDQDASMSAAAFDPDGTRLAAASDHSVSIFDATTGESRARMDYDNEVLTLTFSPDGTRLAVASEDLSLRVVDPATGEQLVRLDHDSPVLAVKFSPDGSKVVTGSGDLFGDVGYTRVFDTNTGEELARLDQDSAVVVVAFTPDGNQAVSVSNDGEVGNFIVEPQVLIQRAFEVMERPLNSAELQRYSLASDCQHIRRKAEGPGGAGGAPPASQQRWTGPT